MGLNKGSFHVNLSDRAKIGIVWIYAGVMAFHHLIRVFDDCFWLDEGFVIQGARMTWEGMLGFVARNGHSPFHYAFAWICVDLFGESGMLYHLSATLPYFITVFFIVTLVRRWFGNKVSVILVTLSALLESAVAYNLEVRMYAWCQMFLFATYLMLYGFYSTKKDIYLLLMMISSLGAVYSHYFALASIGLLYLVLLVYIVKTRSRGMWKVLLSGGAVVLLLLPWLVFAKKTKGVVMSDYKIDQVSWRACLEFIFHSKYSMFLFALFIATLSIRAAFDLGIVQIKKDEGYRRILSLWLDLRNIRLDREWVWIMSGMIAVFGTIAISELISKLIYPIIQLRYLYPSYIMIWILFAIDISKCKLGRLWTVLSVIFIFATCYPHYLTVIKNEHKADRRLEATLAATAPAIDEDAFIYTDIVHFYWSIADVYYPGIPHELFGYAELGKPIEISGLTDGKTYWLFLGAPVSVEVAGRLGEMGYETEMVVDCGYIGTGDVWVYKVVSKTEKRRDGS